MRRLVGFAVAAAAGIVLLLAQPADAQVGVDQVVYVIRTVSPVAGERNIAAVVGVPTPVDTEGDAAPEILVTLSATPGIPLVAENSARLSVAMLTPNRPHALVEVIVRPAAGSSQRLSFGLDGLAHGLPVAFDTTLSATSSGVDVSYTAQSQPRSLGLFGALFDDGPGRPNSRWGLVRLDPAPSAADFGIAWSPKASITVNAPGSPLLKAHYADNAGSLRRAVDVEIDRLPGHVRLDIARAGSDRVDVRYEGSSDIARADVTVVDRTPAGDVDLHVTGRLSDVRAGVADISLDRAEKSLTYSGVPIGRLEALVEGELFDRVRRVALTATDLPPTFVVVVSGQAMRLDTSGGPMGQIDLRLEDAARADALPDGSDGLLLRDLPSRYVVHARITGLRRLLHNASGSCVTHFDCTLIRDISVDADGERPVVLDVRDVEGDREVLTSVGLERLLPATTIRFEQQIQFTLARFPTFAWTPVRTDIRYRTETGQSAGSLTFRTTAGTREGLEASLDPVPEWLILCLSPRDASCTGSGRPASNGAVFYSSPAHSTLNLLDCISTGCLEKIEVTNLRLRHAILELHECGTLCGQLYLDTDDHELTGRVVVTDHEGDLDVDARLPSGFRSENRLRRWNNAIIQGESGTVHCPAGTKLYSDVGFVVNLSAYLCGFLP